MADQNTQFRAEIEIEEGEFFRGAARFACYC
jgi:hypothetical protein